MKRVLTLIALILLLGSSAFSAIEEDLQLKKLNVEKIKYFPVPEDNRNYMFLQAIDNDSYIVIGDFSGLDKMVILITDKNNDNTIDSVVEYFPETKNFRMKKSSNSRFFTSDIAKLKRDIITGAIYNKNYTDEMKSQDALESILNRGDTNAIFEDVYGFVVKLYEVDDLKKNTAQFTYGRNAGGYYLQYRTEFYRKDFRTVMQPMLHYSVYCKDSNDPIVKEYVENLFKIRTPKIVSVK